MSQDDVGKSQVVETKVGLRLLLPIPYSSSIQAAE